MNVLHTRYTSGNTADSVFDLERARFHLWNSSLSPWHANEASTVTTALMTDGNTHSLSEAATWSAALFTAHTQQTSQCDRQGKNFFLGKHWIKESRVKNKCCWYQAGYRNWLWTTEVMSWRVAAEEGAGYQAVETAIIKQQCACDINRACSCKRTPVHYGPFWWGSNLQILRDGDWNSAAHYLPLRGVGSSALLCLWEADCRTKRHKHSLNMGPLPLHTRRRATEAVLNEILGRHNKPKAAVHKVTGPKKKKQQRAPLQSGYIARGSAQVPQGASSPNTSEEEDVKLSRSDWQTQLAETLQ